MVKRYYYKSMIFLILLCIVLLTTSSFLAVAEEDDINISRLTAKLEVTEYARLAGYTLLIDFDELINATDSIQITLAVESLKSNIDTSICNAQNDAAEFDLNVQFLPLINDLTLDDYQSAILLEESYQNLSAISRQFITKYAMLVYKINKIRMQAGEVFLLNKAQLPIDITELEEGVVANIIEIREFYDYYGLDALELNDSHFLFIEAKIEALQKEQNDNESSLIVSQSINELPLVITLVYQQEVESVRIAYNALSEDAKTLVNNYALLLDAETSILELLGYKQRADEYDAALNLIEETVTLEDKAHITSLRLEYNALLEEEKAYVVSLIKLINAEVRIAALEIAKSIADELSISIDMLVDITLEHAELVQSVRNAYDNLTEDAKSFIANYSLLTDAEARLVALNIAKTVADDFSAIIITLPDTVASIDSDDEMSIQNAARYISSIKDDYDALDEDVKSFINNSAVLEQCKDAVHILKDIFDANMVILWINTIGDVFYPEDIPLIESARMAYDALAANAKRFVTNYNILTSLEHNAELYNSTIDAAAAVDSAIISIGIATYAKKDIIVNARAAYENLSEQSRAKVTKLAILTAAEAELIYIINEKETASAVMALIALLPDSVTLEDTENVEYAREAYMNISNTARTFVSNYTELLAKEARITELIDIGIVSAQIIALIDAIPEIITIDNYAEADAYVNSARIAYESVDNEVTTQITNYNRLVLAEYALIDLLSEIESNNVIALIEAMPSLAEIHIDDKDEIEAARAAYNELSERQKTNIHNYTALLFAELKIFTIETAKSSAQSVSTVIDLLPINITIGDEEAINNALSEYNGLSDEAKVYVDNYNKLINAVDALSLILIQKNNAEVVIDFISELPIVIEYTDKAAVDIAYNLYQALNGMEREFVYNAGAYTILMQKYNRISELIFAKAAGDGINDRILLLPPNTLISDKATINLLRSDYNQLSEEAKSFVMFINHLNLIEARLNAAINIDTALALDNIIFMLPETVEFVDEENIKEARESYDALTESQKIYVSMYAKLLDCELQLLELYNAAKRDAAEFDRESSYLIDMQLSLEDISVVVSLREAYDELSDKAKVYVNNIYYLTTAEARMVALNVSAQIAQSFDTLIDALPVVLGLEDMAEVASLREMYDAFTEDERALATRLGGLIAAENAINTLLSDLDTQTVINAINAIPDTITLEDNYLVESARIAYDLLKNKAGVTNYQLLQDAEEVIAILTNNYGIAESINVIIGAIGEVTLDNKDLIKSVYFDYLRLTDAVKAMIDTTILIESLNRIEVLEIALEDAQEVITSIDRLGIITLDKEAIIAALLANHQDLSADAKAYVDNYNLLIAAESEINNLMAEQILASQVIVMIESIGEITLDKSAAITAINLEYQNLSQAAKNMVTNYRALEEANTILYYLNCEQQGGHFDSLIIAIPDTITLDDIALIEGARDYYEGLTYLAKALTNNYPQLINFEKDKNVLLMQYASALAVIDIINALPDNLTILDRQNVKAARHAYSSLSTISRNMVEDVTVNSLIAKEAAIETAYNDYLNALTVYHAIASLSNVALDKATDIIVIREAYDSLTTAERIYVTNGNLLEAAELRIIVLQIALIDAEEVIGLIDSLPSTITLDAVDDIQAARLAFNSLNEDGKAFVDNYSLLIDAETALFDLLRQDYINTVIELIESIADLSQIDAGSITSIIGAREAYNNLFEDYKAAVVNYADLVYAESALNEFLSEERARFVVNLIDTMPEIITIADKDYILSVRSTYDALFAEDKLKVANISILIIAETRLIEILSNYALADEWNSDVRSLLPVAEIDITRQGEVDVLRSRYNLLNEEAKGFVDAYLIFAEMEAHLLAENLRITTEVNLVKTAISLVPNINNLVLRDRDKVAAARNKYDALEEIAKAMVNNYETLIFAELQIYRLQKYSDFNSSVSRLDYRDGEWSTILTYVESFINQLFIADNYPDMDSAYATIINAVSDLPTALDYSKQQAVADIQNYANSIGYSGEIDFSAIYTATSVYQITLFADSISDTISVERQEQIDDAISNTIFNIGNHIVGIVEGYLSHMEISADIEFDITSPTATYTEFREYLVLAYSNDAVELIILLHKRAVVQLMFAENEAAMRVIGEECIADIDVIPTLDADKAAFDIKRAKQLAIKDLSAMISDENRINYTLSNWNNLQIAVIEAMNAISGAESLSEVFLFLENAENTINNVEKGNYYWIIWFFAIILALVTLTFSILFIVLLIQQKRLTAKLLVV